MSASRAELVLPFAGGKETTKLLLKILPIYFFTGVLKWEKEGPPPVGKRTMLEAMPILGMSGRKKNPKKKKGEDRRNREHLGPGRGGKKEGGGTTEGRCGRELWLPRKRKARPRWPPGGAGEVLPVLRGL